jgi:Cu(I)/Ag(I) efflux system membrane fusion protein
VLSVSREAVIRTGHGDRVVLALGDGRFQPRAVVVGLEGGERVEVLSGLAEGDVVVASAQFLLDSEANLRAGLQRLAGGEEEAAESAR